LQSCQEFPSINFDPVNINNSKFITLFDAFGKCGAQSGCLFPKGFERNCVKKDFKGELSLISEGQNAKVMIERVVMA